MQRESPPLTDKEGQGRACRSTHAGATSNEWQKLRRRANFSIVCSFTLYLPHLHYHRRRRRRHRRHGAFGSL
jgi:hypothetical protein